MPQGQGNFMHLITSGIDTYQLLDSGHGRKLERLKIQQNLHAPLQEIVIDRPAPGAVWHPQRKNWAADARVVRQKNGGGHWEFKKNLPATFIWPYQKAGKTIFAIEGKFTPFGHLGAFFEQSVFWDLIPTLSFKSALNLFAYTGIISILAAKQGKSVHLDSATQVNIWAKKNEALNKASPLQIVREDALRFVQQQVRQKKQYDFIFADPPAWGHGAKKEKWEWEKQIQTLIDQIIQILSPGGSFILTSHTPGFSALGLRNLLPTALFSKIDGGELGIQHQDDERILPAGCYVLGCKNYR